MHTVEMEALRFEDVIDSDVLGSGAVQPGLPAWKTALLVALGGMIGTVLRFSLAVLVPTVTTPTLVEMPWATLWANVLGSLGLGALYGALEVRAGRPWMAPLLGVGVCGGFTTFSSVVLEGSAIIGADFPVLALTYAVVTVVAGLGALVVGLVGGRRLAEHRSPASTGTEEGTA